VAHYIVDRSETLRPDGRWLYSPDSVELWVQAIDKLRWLAGHPRPGRDVYVRQALDGIRKEKPRRRKQARPVTGDVLNRILDSIDLTDPIFGTIGNRDYAMILFGFAGAFRQSELTGLRLMDCTVSEDNVLHAYVRRSKTDQLGVGLTKALPRGIDPRTCCLCAYVRWMTILETAINHPGWTRRVLAETHISDHICAGAKGVVYELPEEFPLFPQLRRGGTATRLFANPNAVTQAVHRRVEKIGLDPTQYSGHSLRAGFVTQAYRSGATTHEIMRQTGHRSPSSVEDYSREIDPMLHNAASKLGL
jgi:integrase